MRNVTKEEFDNFINLFIKAKYFQFVKFMQKYVNIILFITLCILITISKFILIRETIYCEREQVGLN